MADHSFPPIRQLMVLVAVRTGPLQLFSWGVSLQEEGAGWGGRLQGGENRRLYTAVAHVIIYITICQDYRYVSINYIYIWVLGI